jgi:hypothetical protein
MAQKMRFLTARLGHRCDLFSSVLSGTVRQGDQGDGGRGGKSLDSVEKTGTCVTMIGQI